METKTREPRKQTEVYIFLQKIYQNSQILIKLGEIPRFDKDLILKYLGMKNCKQNWYSCGIPNKHKTTLRLLEILNKELTKTKK